MADEANVDNKPLAHLSDTERALGADHFDGGFPAAARPAPEAQDFTHAPDNPAPLTAAEQLRAFEDEHFGEDCVRIAGKVERGSGSPYQSMTDEQKRQYAALEKLVVAEQKLADAHAALIQAEADHEAALDAAEPRPEPEPLTDAK